MMSDEVTFDCEKCNLYGAEEPDCPECVPVVSVPRDKYERLREALVIVANVGSGEAKRVALAALREANDE